MKPDSQTTTNHSHLWNDMPFEERKRLMPFSIQTHILHLEQAKSVAVRAHRQHMQELDDWINNLRRSLSKEVADA
jgi:hypothetical protein